MIAILLLALSVWFVTRAYGGIVHDARLYLVQALSGLEDSPFAQDLYLKYGSQDRWTVFSRLYVALVPHWGPVRFHHVATLVLGIFWVVSFIAVVRKMRLHANQIAVTAAAAIAVGSQYGAFPVFSFGEPFVSPRLLAEALCLSAFALHLESRSALAISFVAVSVGVHPLMTIPVALWFLLLLMPPRRALMLMTVGGVAVIGLAMARIEPFGRLLQSFDQEWFSLVSGRLSFALPTEWSLISLGPLTVHILGLIHLRTISGSWKKRIDSLVVVAGALMLIALIGELWRNVLLVNLQLWRVLWVVAVFGTTGLARWAMLLKADDPLFVPAMTALATGVLERVAGLPPLFSPISVIAIVVSAGRLRGTPTQLRTMDAVHTIVPLASLLASLSMIVLTDGRTNGGAYPLRTTLDVILIGAAIVVAGSSLRRKWTLVAASILALVAFARSERRSPWQRFVESPAYSREIDGFLDGHKQVYWEEGVELLWLKQGRPSFYSCLQGTGLMFFRATAMEYQRRGLELAQLGGRGFERVIGTSCEVVTRSQPQHTEGTLTQGVCRSLPELDAIVLPRVPSGEHPDRTLAMPVLRTVVSAKTSYHPGSVYLFSCERFRGGFER